MLNGPDIRKLMRNGAFDDCLSEDELSAWQNIKAVLENVIGNFRAHNWKSYVDNMLQSFEKINVNMSLKIHFLHYHQDYFDRQLPSESDEHGERFHQVSAQLEHWYSGKRLNSLLADLCWNLQSELDNED